VYCNGCVSYAGTRCEERNSCASAPCVNGGQCTSLVADDGQESFSCRCPEEFEGRTCETDVNECDVTSELCLSGGTCINTVGSYR